MCMVSRAITSSSFVGIIATLTVESAAEMMASDERAASLAPLKLPEHHPGSLVALVGEVLEVAEVGGLA